MKKCILALTMAASACMAAPALAQSTITSAAATSTMSTDSLYQVFGEKPGLVRLMDDFMVRLLADPRTQPHFKSVDQGRVKAQLVDQICMALGGPCVYKGADMRALHRNLDITKSDFHALVEVLQLSMDAQGLAFHTQNKLLALLAPMHRDVITVQN